MLHTNTPKSDQSKKRKAREIMYSWGKANVDDLKQIIKDSDEPDKYVAVRIEALCNSLIKGVEALREDIANNTNLHNICSTRIKEFYCDTRV